MLNMSYFELLCWHQFTLNWVFRPGKCIKLITELHFCYYSELLKVLYVPPTFPWVPLGLHIQSGWQKKHFKLQNRNATHGSLKRKLGPSLPQLLYNVCVSSHNRCVSNPAVEEPSYLIEPHFFTSRCKYRYSMYEWGFYGTLFVLIDNHFCSLDAPFMGISGIFKATSLLPKEEVGDWLWESESFCDQCEAEAHPKNKKYQITGMYRPTPDSHQSQDWLRNVSIFIFLPYEGNQRFTCFLSVCSCIPQTNLPQPLITDV